MTRMKYNWNLFFSGPSYWKSLGYSACENQAQSPIDLPSMKSMTYKSSLGQFTLSEFNNKNAYTLLLKNNGHAGMYVNYM